jgi:hypothetical protein
MHKTAVKKLGARVLIGGLVAIAALLSTGTAAQASYWDFVEWRGKLSQCDADGQLEVRQNGALGYYCAEATDFGWDLFVQRP